VTKIINIEPCPFLPSHIPLITQKMATSPFTSLFPLTSSSTTSHSKLSPFRAFIKASAPVSVPETHFQSTPRREFLKGIALSLPLIALTEPPQSQAREVSVGSFLPPSSSDPSFVLFKASPKDTPALRAGTLIDLSIFKSFVLLFFTIDSLDLVLCRKCAAIPVHPSPNMETASDS